MDLWAVFPTGRMASAKARAFVAYVRGVADPGSPESASVSFIAIFVYFE
jgi:hypothetical protein